MDHDATEYVISDRDYQLKRMEEIRTALSEARETGNWTNVPPQVFKEYLDRIIVSSAPSLVNQQIVGEIDVISAECFFSVTLPDPSEPFKDQTIVEQDFQNARLKVMQQLRAQALRCSADAVICVDLRHTLVDATEGSRRFLLAATGTAVRLAQKENG
jgi:uncharacterized protein YbjQ (UPF0145 family)